MPAWWPILKVLLCQLIFFTQQFYMTHPGYLPSSFNAFSGFVLVENPLESLVGKFLGLFGDSGIIQDSSALEIVVVTSLQRFPNSGSQEWVGIFDHTAILLGV